MLNIAFKEWAVVCQALAERKQSLISRKRRNRRGGQHVSARTHAASGSIRPMCISSSTASSPNTRQLLKPAENDRPAKGTVRLSHFVDVPCVYHVADLKDNLLMLDGMHFWTEETVRQRFEYRHPGIYASCRAARLADAANV